MTLTEVPGGSILLPAVDAATSQGALRTGLVLDTADNYHGVVYRVPARYDGLVVDQLGMLVQALGSGSETIDARVETVDLADGFPTGTLATTNANLSKAITAAGWNDWALTANHTLTGGELLCFRFNYVSGTSLTTRESFRSQLGCSGWDTFPHAVSQVGAGGEIKTGANIGDEKLNFGVHVTSGDWLMINGFPTITSFGNQNLSSTATPSEAGLEFQVPFPCTLAGAVLNIDSDGDYDLVLGNSSYVPDDTGATRLEFQAVDKDVSAGAAVGSELVEFSNAVELAANTDYRLVVKATTTTITNLRTVTFDDAAMVTSVGANSTWHWIEDDGAAGWTNTTTRLPQISLVLSHFDNAAGGGVSSVAAQSVTILVRGPGIIAY